MAGLVSFALISVFIHGSNAATKACPYRPVDIVFILDGSGSEGAAGFNKQLDFVQNYTGNFEIGPNHTQVALITFATTAGNAFFLDKHADAQSLLNDIHRTHYPNGETNTHVALNLARTSTLKSRHGARDGVPKLVIVMTDGHSLEESKTVREAVALKGMPGVTVVSIGIGHAVDGRELQVIATDAKHAFHVQNFDSLHLIHDDLVDRTCQLCLDDQAEIMFVLDSSGSEGPTNFFKQLEFVNMVINDFIVGPNATQIGVVSFATRSRLEIDLNKYDDGSALMEAVLKIDYMNGETYTDLGLNLALGTLTGNHGARFGANRYCIVLTDGRSTEEDRTISAANKLHRHGVEVFAVAIGPHVDPIEINHIASDNNHTYFVHDFDGLDDIHKDINNAICSQKNIIPTTTTTTTTPKPTTHTTLPTTTTKPECGQKPADVLFLLDESDSEGAENFQQQLNFVQKFASQFTIGPKNVLFSLATFSSGVTNHFYFNTYSNRHDVLHAIQSIPYTGLGTNTSLALKFAREESFKPEHGARDNATQIVVVVTDGRSFDPNSTATEAKLLHHKAEVFSIGIGPDVDVTELQAIASNNHNVVRVDNFQLLHTIEKQLTDTACA